MSFPSAPAASSSSSCSSAPHSCLPETEISACQHDWADPPFDHATFRQRLRSNLEGCAKQIRLHPDTVLCDFVGLLHECANNYADAQRSFEQALQLDPSNHIAHANLQRVLQTKGMVADMPKLQSQETPECDAQIRRAGLAWWSRAFYHMRMYHPVDGLRCFEQALHFIPNEPKLRFYYATLLNRTHKHASHSLARTLLQPMLQPSTTGVGAVSPLEVLAQLVRADAGSTRSVHERVHLVAMHVKQAEALSNATTSSECSDSESLHTVCIFAADAFAHAGKEKEAFELYTRAIERGSNSTHAYHNRAGLHRKAGRFVEAEADLIQAIKCEPDSYAALMDLILLRIENLHKYDAAVADCTRMLNFGAKVGRLNCIRTWELKGRALLELRHAEGAQFAFEEMLPLITAYEAVKKPKPISPNGRTVQHLKSTLIAQLTPLYARMVEPHRAVRIIDMHLQLRSFEAAQTLIAQGQRDFPASPDLQYQAARLRLLEHLAQADYARAVDVQMQAARKLLCYAVAGDMCGLGATNTLADASASSSSVVSNPPRLALSLPDYRRALVHNLLRTLEHTCRGPGGDDLHASAANLERGLRALWILHAEPHQGVHVTSRDSADTYRRTLLLLVEKLQQLFCFISEQIALRDPHADPMRSIPLSLAPVRLAARLVMGLHSVGATDQFGTVQAVYAALGSYPSSMAAGVQRACSVHSALASTLAFDSGSSQSQSESFLDTAQLLVKLRAREVEWHVLQMRQQRIKWTKDANVHCLVAASGSSEPPLTSKLSHLAAQIFVEAKSLLDYFILAFRRVACPNIVQACETAEAAGRTVKHLNFPRTPLHLRGSTRQLLAAYLSHRDRLGSDFDSRFPCLFAALLHLQPREDAARNGWLTSLCEARNTGLHSRSINNNDVQQIGQTTLSTVDLAQTALREIPRILYQLKQAASTDFMNANASSSSTCARSPSTSLSTAGGSLPCDAADFRDSCLTHIEAQLQQLCLSTPDRSTGPVEDVLAVLPDASPSVAQVFKH